MGGISVMDNSVIGLVIVSVIAVFGLSAFYVDFVHARRKSNPLPENGAVRGHSRAGRGTDVRADQMAHPIEEEPAR
jgi:hypothetical protein